MDHDGKKGEMIFMDKVELDKYSPLHKTGHTSKVINVNGRLRTCGTRRIIWDMRAWQRYLFRSFWTEVN